MIRKQTATNRFKHQLRSSDLRVWIGIFTIKLQTTECEVYTRNAPDSRHPRPRPSSGSRRIYVLRKTAVRRASLHIIKACARLLTQKKKTTTNEPVGLAARAMISDFSQPSASRVDRFARNPSRRLIYNDRFVAVSRQFVVVPPVIPQT